ncbi:MAG TPA: ABC transporter ATP-binding protein, partial [Chloroflexi bacterium]|nr:ABC transporter ATP-binding protein [Chloroflexota bacterium]
MSEQTGAALTGGTNLPAEEQNDARVSPNASSPASDQSILRVENLHTYFFTDLGISRALNGVSLQVPTGKVLGVVGESGCGKSVTALSVMRLVPHPGRVVKGHIYLRRARRRHGNFSMDEEIELTALDPNGPVIRSIRGAEIAMIFQEPMTSLNPSYTIGDQIAEAVILHQEVTKAEAIERAAIMLDRVGMPNPRAVVTRYPHELSGGMRQRAMIAMALSCTPSILFADEPTTALDVTTEAQILDVMRELQNELGMTTVFITHNLGVVAQMCDNVAVMYLGRVVEQAPVEGLFYDPQHPYSKALLRSIPHVGSRTRARLEPIRGVVPDPYSSISGCPFHPRCDSFIPGTCDICVPAMTHT